LNHLSPRWFLQSRPRAWLSYGLVISLVLIVVMGLVRQALKNDLDVNHRATERELALVGSLVSDALRRGDYQNLDSLLQDWAKANVGLTKMQVVGPSGFVLSAYDSSASPEQVLNLTLPIDYSYRGQATLSLTRDQSPVYERNAAFRNQLFLLMLAVSGSLGVVLFLLLKRQEEAGVLRRRTEALRESEEHLRTIIDTEPECIKLLDADGRLIEMNAAGLAMIEADSLEQVAGQSLYNLLLPEYREAFRTLLKSVLQGNKEILAFEIQGLKGARRWLETHSVPMTTRAGETVLLGVTRDITERRRAEERLSYLAHHDELTGLPNRTLFTDRLEQAMIEAERHERLVAVVFLDVDRFKGINDTLGHEVGDQLLKGVAERLLGAVRRGDTVARLSGDEFTLVLADIAHVDDAARVAQKILDTFAQPLHVAGRDLFMSVSLGLTLFPFDTHETQALLRNADVAMYRAKEAGRNCYQFYTAEMTTKAVERMGLENALRLALQHAEFLLHYQPIVAPDGRLVGVEALIRWQHPDRGLMSPLEFIPLAEDTGLIVPLGEWVLHTACAQLRHWHSAGFPELQLSVNLSARQFQQKNLAQTVAHATRAAGIERVTSNSRSPKVSWHKAKRSQRCCAK